MAGRYPKEFKDDVVRVARKRGPGETLEQIAHDFGVHPVTLSKWLRQADVFDSVTISARKVDRELVEFDPDHYRYNGNGSDRGYSTTPSTDDPWSLGPL